jgi:hypothetical protein
MSKNNIDLLLLAIELKEKITLFRNFSDSDLDRHNKKRRITNEIYLHKKRSATESEDILYKHRRNNLHTYLIKNLDKKYFYNEKQHVIIFDSFDKIIKIIYELNKIRFDPNKFTFTFHDLNTEIVFILHEINYKFEFRIYRYNKKFVMIPHSIPLKITSESYDKTRVSKYITLIRFMIKQTNGDFRFLYRSDE